MPYRYQNKTSPCLPQGFHIQLQADKDFSCTIIQCFQRRKGTQLQLSSRNENIITRYDYIQWVKEAAKSLLFPKYNDNTKKKENHWPVLYAFIHMGQNVIVHCDHNEDTSSSIYSVPEKTHLCLMSCIMV